LYAWLDNPETFDYRAKEQVMVSLFLNGIQKREGSR